MTLYIANCIVLYALFAAHFAQNHIITKTFYSKIIHQHRNTKLKRDCVSNHINKYNGYIQITYSQPKEIDSKISANLISLGVLQNCAENSYALIYISDLQNKLSRIVLKTLSA